MMMHSGSHLNIATLHLCNIKEKSAKGSRSEPEDGRRPSSGELSKIELNIVNYDEDEIYN